MDADRPDVGAPGPDATPPAGPDPTSAASEPAAAPEPTEAAAPGTAPAAPRKTAARKSPAAKAPARKTAARKAPAKRAPSDGTDSSADATDSSTEATPTKAAARKTASRKAVAAASRTAVPSAGSVTSEVLRATGDAGQEPTLPASRATTVPVLPAAPPEPRTTTTATATRLTERDADPGSEPAGSDRGPTDRGPAAGGTGRRPGSRRTLLRVVAVLVLVVLGGIAGLVAARSAAPVYTATAQVLVRDRDYAAIVLGQAATGSGGTPQRAVAAQVLAAQSSSFAAEVARRANLDATVVTDALTVTASPDADVVVFSAAAPDPALAATIVDTASTYEVTAYRDQLVNGLGSISSGGALDATQTAQLAQAQAFERISPSAEIISSAGQPSGGPVPASRGLLVGAAAGAVVGFLLLGLEAAVRSRRRPGPADGGTGPATAS